MATFGCPWWGMQERGVCIWPRISAHKSLVHQLLLSLRYEIFWISSVVMALNTSILGSCVVMRKDDLESTSIWPGIGRGVPQVTLDTTLAELYTQDADQQFRVALVPACASSEVALCKSVPNTKYLVQERAYNSTPRSISSQQRDEIQRDEAIKLLAITSHRDAFIAGNMPVILFNPIGGGQSQKEAEKTMNALTAVQKPRMLFFDAPRQISMKENGIHVLAAKLPLDELEGFPQVVDLDMLYFLNSKAALCTSGLPRYVGLILRLISFYARV